MPPTLTYCTNLFPAETLADVHWALGRYSALRRRLGGIDRLPVGLHLSARACEELENERAMDEFEQSLRSHELRVVTLNAFPFGGFHESVVKERVFEPAWDENPRRHYTERACRILARLIPRGAVGSVSTHSGYYKKDGVDPARDARIARAWLRTAVELSRIEEDTGRRIILSIEPEPFSRLETVRDIIEFLEFIFGPAMQRQAADWSVTPAWLEGAARRHLGICYDACHQAVEFEDAVQGIAALRAAGITIGKIQASVAPALARPSENPRAVARLREFAEPRYFHQTFGRTAGGDILKYTDLAPALDDAAFLERSAEIRTHFHVPIFLQQLGEGGPTTTRDSLQQLLSSCVDATSCVEIETYTMSALPEPPTSDAVLIETMASEWRFAASALRLQLP